MLSVVHFHIRCMRPRPVCVSDPDIQVQQTRRALGPLSPLSGMTDGLVWPSIDPALFLRMSLLCSFALFPLLLSSSSFLSYLFASFHRSGLFKLTPFVPRHCYHPSHLTFTFTFTSPLPPAPPLSHSTSSPCLPRSRGQTSTYPGSTYPVSGDIRARNLCQQAAASHRPTVLMSMSIPSRCGPSVHARRTRHSHRRL